MTGTASKKISGMIIKGMTYLFALIAVVTGSIAFVAGTHMVPTGDAVSASLDNEFRFFSVFWLAYGVLCFLVARDLDARKNWIPGLAATMMLAGLARTASTMLVGMPLPQFFYSIGIELVFPVVMYMAYRKYKAA